MPGLGTVVNSAAIIIAGLIGLTFGKGLTERYQETMLSACGLSTLFIGIGGVMSGMLVLTESGLSTQGSVMMAASLVLPALPYLLSFAAGAMMYVVVEELIPEMSSGKHSNLGTVFFALGFTLMMTLDVALG